MRVRCSTFILIALITIFFLIFNIYGLLEILRYFRDRNLKKEFELRNPKRFNDTKHIQPSITSSPRPTIRQSSTTTKPPERTSNIPWNDDYQETTRWKIVAPTTRIVITTSEAPTTTSELIEETTTTTTTTTQSTTTTLHHHHHHHGKHHGHHHHHHHHHHNKHHKTTQNEFDLARQHLIIDEQPPTVDWRQRIDVLDRDRGYKSNGRLEEDEVRSDHHQHHQHHQHHHHHHHHHRTDGNRIDEELEPIKELTTTTEAATTRIRMTTSRIPTTSKRIESPFDRITIPASSSYRNPYVHKIASTTTQKSTSTSTTTTSATTTTTEMESEIVEEEEEDDDIYGFEFIHPTTDDNLLPTTTAEKARENEVDEDVTEEDKTERDSTIVTALIDIGRGDWWQYRRPLTKYHQFMENVLSLKNKMVIFVDESSYEFVKSYRSKHHLDNITRVYQISIQDLPLYGYIGEAKNIIEAELSNDTFYTQIADSDMKTHPEAKSAEYNIVVNSKTHFLHNATIDDPFGTEYFIWIDAGYGHGNQSVFPISNVWRPTFPKDKISLIKLTPEYDKLSSYSLDNLYRKNWAVLSGGFIAGNKHFIGQLHHLIHRKFIQLIYQKYVDDDQTLLVLAVNSHPYLFNIVHGDWFDAFRLFSIDAEQQIG